jgi:hypothetical protein
MIRQIARFILMIVAGIWSIVRKYPGATLGFLIGGVIGYVLGYYMVKYGFPGWSLPIMVIAFALKMAVISKEYLDKLKK